MEDTTMLEDENRPVFEDLVFVVIPNGNAQQEEQIKEDILKNGGRIQEFDPDKGRIEDLAELTHIISSTSDFPDFEATRDQFTPHVVKPNWIPQSIHRNKPANPRSFNPDPALFMSSVTICVGSDLPDGDRDNMIGLVIAVGGQDSPVLLKSVTHLIALNMDDPRCQLADNKNLKCKKVLPHWIDDCFRLGRMLPTGPYTLPDPDILKNSADLGPIANHAPSQHIRDATTPAPTDIPTPVSSPSAKRARSIPAFSGKRIMLSDDLQLESRMRTTIEELISNGGGQMTSDIDEADSYVCQYRNGTDYIKASQAKKDVGNLSWLFHLITYNTWTSPMRRLLHYPIPKDGIPGFEDQTISLSNYAGDARVYLENLIKATGAKFTKTFRQENTQLITAHEGGQKCEAAKEWNIDVINHLWLEDSYARCEMMAVTDPKYTYFPRRTNLGEILGQTQIDRQAVEMHYYPSPDTAVSRIKKVTKRGRRATDGEGTEQVATPLAARTKGRIQSESNFTTPAIGRHSSEKENETPGTSGSRGAKSRAMSKIAESATDIALFQKEMKRAGGVLHGGRRDKTAGDAAEKAKKGSRESTGSKRSFDEMSIDGPSTEDEPVEAPKKAKKARKEKDKKPPIQYRMVVSKYDRWAHQGKKESDDKTKLRELGIAITEKPSTANMLCAPVIVRTKKFVTALAVAPTVVHTSFLDYALEHHELPPVEDHPLLNPEFEALHGFSMDESLVRAHENKGRLLKNWTIFCTTAVSGGFDTMKEIVEANGGVCLKWEGRKSVRPTHRTVDAPETQDMSQNLTEDDGNTLYLISEGKKSEVPMWKKFRELAAEHSMTPRIVKTEWLLFVAMAQYIHYKEEWALNEENLKSA
ncbi:hypothetical protein BU16DRAFT_526557 [Lophium mytilinum]|uniref:BRCT domain-containing protein n=1 Tax=Lophium mytilinum TaxID=390894 RepID=A0A6A6QY90_9PEZI|nr:hypothetical protein BU16DRAFT_526557 [Lophium mytilinum]